MQHMMMMSTGAGARLRNEGSRMTLSPTITSRYRVYSQDLYCTGDLVAEARNGKYRYLSAVCGTITIS